MKTTGNNSSKIKGESLFKKGTFGWVIAIIFEGCEVRYVHSIGEDGHKTFHYSTLAQLRKNHKKASFFSDEYFDWCLGILEGMICNGYRASLVRCVKDDYDFTKKEDK